LHERALTLAAEAFGAGHPIVVTFQANYGLALVRRGQLDRAESVLEGALGSMSARDRASHRQAAKIHSSLSKRYYQGGNLDRAAEHGRASLEIHRRARSADSDVAEVLMELADIEFRRRNFDGALALYENALGLWRNLDGHDNLGVTEGDIAETLFELERYDEALPHLATAERIFEHGVNRKNQAWILTVRGEILAGKRQFGAAIPVLERALALFDDGGVDPTNHVLAMWTLARALHELGRDGDRVRLLAERARAIFAAQGAVGAHNRDATARFIDRLPARQAPGRPRADSGPTR
jgi:tetratricopeptide (TPR) repeat protein